MLRRARPGAATSPGPAPPHGSGELKLWMRSRTRSALVNVTSAILPRRHVLGGQQDHWTRLQVTTDPVPHRTIRSSRCPSSRLTRRRTDPRRAADYRANVD
jgi:hypothetical protein